MNVYHNLNGDPLALEDDHQKKYTLVQGPKFETYTWEEIPIELHT